MVPTISLTNLALLPCLLSLSLPSAIASDITKLPKSSIVVSNNLAFPVVGLAIATLEFIKIVLPISFPISYPASLPVLKALKVANAALSWSKRTSVRPNNLPKVLEEKFLNILLNSSLDSAVLNIFPSASILKDLSIIVSSANPSIDSIISLKFLLINLPSEFLDWKTKSDSLNELILSLKSFTVKALELAKLISESISKLNTSFINLSNLLYKVSDCFLLSNKVLFISLYILFLASTKYGLPDSILFLIASLLLYIEVKNSYSSSLVNPAFLNLPDKKSENPNLLSLFFKVFSSILE